MEIIPREETLRLLATQAVGRLAFVEGDQPMIVPVNYAFVDGVIIFRTGEGAKLDVVPSTKVAFEVDGVDQESRTGWSVVVRGIGEEITGDPHWFVDKQRRAAAPPWPPGAKDHYIRIVPRAISGRRIAVPFGCSR